MVVVAEKKRQVIPDSDNHSIVRLVSSSLLSNFQLTRFSDVCYTYLHSFNSNLLLSSFLSFLPSFLPFAFLHFLRTLPSFFAPLPSFLPPFPSFLPSPPSFLFPPLPYSLAAISSPKLQGGEYVLHDQKFFKGQVIHYALRLEKRMQKSKPICPVTICLSFPIPMGLETHTDFNYATAHPLLFFQQHTNQFFVLLAASNSSSQTHTD
eukprot:GHVT01062511.1.p1 GENE.GHVT01062511.1~~GHVT01062511.1.p1  ORF type:complete len:207 (-),score=41.36 GHVT01062511.1:1146-1766(-)